MSQSPPSPGRGRSLSELRQAFAAAVSDEDLMFLLKELSADARVGARQLADRGRRLLATRAGERERMARLLALRDELVAGGVRGVAGIDEVGVGPLAGPVVAAAVILPTEVMLDGLDDSKRVPRARRERLAAEIREYAIGIGIGEVSPEEIDQRNIYQASLARGRGRASACRCANGAGGGSPADFHHQGRLKGREHRGGIDCCEGPSRRTDEDSRNAVSRIRLRSA